MNKRKVKRTKKRYNRSYMFMEEHSGKHFTISEPFGENTVVYEIYKLRKEYLHMFPEYAVERVEFTESIGNNECRKTFYIEDPAEKGNQLLILTFCENKKYVKINNGLLIGDEVRISKDPTYIQFERISSKNGTNYVEITGNLRKKVVYTVIDPLTTQEIRPELYYDEDTEQVICKYKFIPYQNYLIFTIIGDDCKL